MKTEITHSANTTQQQPTICTIIKKKKSFTTKENYRETQNLNWVINQGNTKQGCVQNHMV